MAVRAETFLHDKSRVHQIEWHGAEDEDVLGGHDPLERLHLFQGAGRLGGRRRLVRLENKRLLDHLKRVEEFDCDQVRRLGFGHEDLGLFGRDVEHDVVSDAL